MEAIATAGRASPSPADQSGAIGIAARWCAAARDQYDPPEVMAFGTPQSAHVLVGATRRLCLQRYAGDPVPEAALWRQLDEFSGQRTFLAGYIGFDAVWPDGTPRPGQASTPTLQLWEPEGVIRIDVTATGTPLVSVLRNAPVLSTLVPRPLGAFETVAMHALDGDTHPFREAVALTIRRIRQGEGKRLTIARRVDLPPWLDLLGSFAAPPPGPARLGRSFYLATPALEMAGHSPELLGQGDASAFDCYKLSGTAPRHRDTAEDERLRRSFLADAKILHEHELSIGATRAALEDLGAVSRGAMEVLDRRGLRHVLTPLHVDVAPDTSWSRIIRALLPCGAQPRASGLDSLAGFEPVSRGAYYGLVGLRTPEGSFELSQVLRTLFRDHSGTHAWVGAAVTEGSTVDGESNETKLKLDDIVGRRRVPGSGSGRGRQG